MSKTVVRLEKRFWELLGYLVIVASVCLSVVFWQWVFLLIPFAWYCGVLLIERVRFLLFGKTPLEIKTPDGYNEPYHPSVLYFENGWKGYRYWMAFTPMPMQAKGKPYIDRWECPCVYASQDGIHFSDAFQNGFLDDLTASEIENRDYFSDPHLVYNEALDRIELYYRLTHRSKTHINNEILLLLRKTTTDGAHWREREVLIDSSSEDLPTGRVYVSPAVIRENGRYRMWFVSSYGGEGSVSVSDSDNMTVFSPKKDCTFSGREVNPWHIDCRKVGDRYVMLVYESTNEISVWKSDNGIDFSFRSVVLKHSGLCGQFFHTLYRACLSECEEERWRIYFSARSTVGNGIGVAEGDSPETCKVIDGGGNPRLFWRDFKDRIFHLLLKLCGRRKNA